MKEEEARLLHDQLRASGRSPSPDGAWGDGRRESVETQSTTSVNSDSLLLAEHANDVSSKTFKTIKEGTKTLTEVRVR